MPYSDNRERSAELLRMALVHMGQHSASLNPMTYTVWYEFVSGQNVRLIRAVERLMEDGKRLDDDLIRQVYRDHVAVPEDTAVQRINEQMQQAMSRMAASAHETGQQAGAFNRQLDGLNQALQSEDVAQLATELQAAQAQTAAMQRATRSLQDQVMASEREIDALRKDLARVREEAFTDGLTRTLNRKGLDQRLNLLMTRPASPGREHCLVLLDIDHFKRVNDSYGHLTGDRVLQSVGDVLRGVTSAPPRLAARYGGEEFVLLIPETTMSQTREIAERVRQLTKGLRFRHKDAPGGELSVTLSAGVASLMPEESLSDWLARADAALYKAKQGGRDQVVMAAS